MTDQNAITATWRRRARPVIDQIGRYTATMYTLASIYDVGKRLLLNSQAAMEADVRILVQREVARRIVGRRFPRVLR